MTEILQNLLSKADLLIVFIGMAALLWKAMSALATLAHLLATEQQQAPIPKPVLPPVPPLPVPVPAPKPTVTVVPTSVVVDQGLVDFIKKFEGFRTTAYWDYKQYSIGYGTKANSSTEVIDEPEALRRLTLEINSAEQAVEKVAKNAPKGVKQALTDLTYNAGSGWEQQALGQLILAGSYEEAKAHVLQYNHAGGVVNAGLTARREAEVKMFDNPL
jgi:GH24 family phage-related lysozyme (muramidase)